MPSQLETLQKYFVLNRIMHYVQLYYRMLYTE